MSITPTQLNELERLETEWQDWIRTHPKAGPDARFDSAPDCFVKLRSRVWEFRKSLIEAAKENEALKKELARVILVKLTDKVAEFVASEIAVKILSEENAALKKRVSELEAIIRDAKEDPEGL